MNEPIETTRITTTTASRRGRCLVDGCTCKDSRIVSRRRAAFFAWLATGRGQTANRVIAPDPSWAIPGPSVA
jgi:hypothetical protein